jgi:PhzF family phenazine biosynthesis protein
VLDVRGEATARVFGRAGAAETGNPATVLWLGDDTATDQELIAEAARRGTPATAFLWPGEVPRVRFFTPVRELAFCGHGALAAGAVAGRRAGASAVRLRAGGREIAVELTASGLATLTMAGPGTVRRESAPAAVLGALGAAGAAGAAIGEVVVASVGSPKWLVEVTSAAALRALAPDHAALAALSRAEGVNGAYVFTRAGVPAGVDALARGFNPHGGVDEDAATGVAAGALAWWLRDALAGRDLVVEQGIGLAALNRLVARVDGDRICVGGHVVVAGGEGS